MVADEWQLTLIAYSDDKRDLERVISIVSRHLERFAFRENPTLVWRYFER